MKKNTIIELIDVTKTYYLNSYKPTLSEKTLLPLINNRRYKSFKNDKTFIALDGINLTIKKGDRIGIIGENGSGKTTLLKLIAGITMPTTGSVFTSGSIVSLIDLEAGFHPELTGAENVLLNGLIVGMSKIEIQERFEKIEQFADIGGFFHAPLYTYSLGMKLRLGFSIAIHADPDILILDEGSAAGDADFREKMRLSYNSLIAKKKTMISVSHWTSFLEGYLRVNKVISMSEGKISKVGGVELLNEKR